MSFSKLGAVSREISITIHYLALVVMPDFSQERVRCERRTVV